MGKILQALGLQESEVQSVTGTNADPGELATLQRQVDDAVESMWQMQRAMEDAGWSTLGEQYVTEFTREASKRAAEVCRLMFVGNPLIKRGLSLRAAYVHGQGVGITAVADGNEGAQDVNAVVQQFLDDDRNREALTGQKARVRLENSLGTDGNVYIALFTNPLTGRVQPRTLPFDEVEDKITAPGDKLITWFYKRVWMEEGKTLTAYYPDIRYRPATKARYYRNGDDTLSEIKWDSPVYHLMDNYLDGWKFGVGDAYPAVPWARAQKGFLEDWALMMKAVSKIAYQVSTKKTPNSQVMRGKVQNANLAELPAGSTVSMSEGTTLEAMPKSGATIDSESGKPLAAMVASAMGVPVTMLLSDPGQTGARAVAETLNQPTILEFKGRQELWTEAFRAILGYVIDQAVIAPRGPLKGTQVLDGDTRVVTLAGDTDRTLKIVWPEIAETPLDVLIAALVDIAATNLAPPLVMLEQMLRAIGVRDVDEILAKVTDADGNFIDPTATAGDNAAQAFRRGEDPAQANR